MAGYSKRYCVGGLGGFQGADGINPILLQILVGDSDRQWLEAHYFDKSIKQLGKIKIIIPAKPNDENSLLDACLAFFPSHFVGCNSLNNIREKLNDVKRLDFHVGMNEIPKEWNNLREEAKGAFKKLNIFEAELRKIDL